MLTVLILVALLVAMGGAAAGVMVYGAEKRKRLGGSSSTPNLLPGDVLRERGLKELKPGDVVTLDGKDYLCEGVIEYDEDGHRWVGGRLVDGDQVRWCIAGLERVGNSQVRVLEHDTTTDVAGYPPEALVIADVRFTLDKRGNATCRLHGDLGNLLGTKNRPEGHVERCRWWLYSAPGDDTAVLEQWGADYRVLRGKKVRGDMIDLIPGS